MANSAHLHLPPSSCRRLPVPTNFPTRPVASAGTCQWRRLPASSHRLRAADASRQLDYVEFSSLAAAEEDEGDRPLSLRIAIIGFGNYGQFLARTFVAQGHTVLAHSRSDHSAAAASIGATFFPDTHDLCKCHPDVVLLATSILFAEDVVLSLPVHRLRRDTLLADVLSVKEFPKKLLLENLPDDFDIICTHPMFGPESTRDGWAGLPFIFDRVRVGDSSARDGWAGLPFIFDRVRVGDSPARRARAEAFLDIFARAETSRARRIRPLSLW